MVGLHAVCCSALRSVAFQLGLYQIHEMLRITAVLVALCKIHISEASIATGSTVGLAIAVN